MEQYKKESLDKLIDLIANISKSPKYEWFKEELIRKLDLKPPVEKTDDVSEDKVPTEVHTTLNNIEEYLNIKGVEIIDYSAIQNTIIRTQLTRDCIEMHKYRLGIINNKIDFQEFCRYAHLQAEEISNYFLIEYCNSEINNINIFLKKHYSKKFKNFDYPNYKELVKISFPVKIHGILEEFVRDSKLKKDLMNLFEFSNKVRNGLSHRNSLSSENNDSKMMKAVQKGYNFDKFNDIKGFSAEDKKIYFDGLHVYKVNKQDYREIIIALDILKSIIVKALKSKEMTLN